MRAILAAALPLAALAACEASDEAVRNEFRQGSIQGCLQSAGNAPAPPGFDWERLCTCATDRVMAGKTGRELARLEPGTADQRRIVAECLAEIQRGGTKSGR